MADAFYYSVLVKAGSEALNVAPETSSITVEEAIALPHKLTLQLRDPYRVLTHALREGVEIEIELGTKAEHVPVFLGAIYHVRGSMAHGDIPEIVVEAYDATMRLGLRARSRPLPQGKLSDIVRGMAQKVAINDVKTSIESDPTFEQEDAGPNPEYQINQTDLDYLQTMAHRYNCDMFVDVSSGSEQLVFGSLSELIKQDPIATVVSDRLGVKQCLQSFEATVDLGSRLPPAVHGAMSAAKGEAHKPVNPTPVELTQPEDTLLSDNLSRFKSQFPERASSIDALLKAAKTTPDKLKQSLPPYRTVRAPALLSAAEFSLRDKSFQSATSLLGERCRASMCGLPHLMAHRTINVINAGRFAGKWYLSTVRHVVDAQAYMTEFECTR